MDVYRSKQLRYLPIGDVKHEEFFAELMQETGTLNFDTSLPTGFTMAQVGAATKVMATRKLMAMYVCRQSGHGDPTPVGAVSLSKPEERHTQHGNAALSLVIRQQDRRRGYGKEAIAWALDWAFDFARLHRVEIAYFDWNPGAGRLYESLGFRKEGVKREAIWFMGAWHDMHEMAILEHEWRGEWRAKVNAGTWAPEDGKSYSSEQIAGKMGSV